MTTIILGMHRSGTSVLGNILSEMDWSIGRSPMLAGDDNPLGFSENRMLMSLHDEMLFEANSTWSDPHPISANHWTPSRTEIWAERIQNLLHAEFGEDERPLIKDPRMCRLLPAWRHALASDWKQILFFLPVRHPMEVAASLQARDGMSLEYGTLLWLTHFFEAEFQTRDTRRLFLLQDRLISGTENQRIADFSGTSLHDVEAAHQAAVRTGLRHHQSENTQILPGSLLGDLATELWQNILALTSGSENYEQIDTLRNHYSKLLSLIPREFRGTATTGSLPPSCEITTFLEPFDPEATEVPRLRTFLDRAGAAFTARFPITAEYNCPLLWRAILPAPCEIEVHRVLLQSEEIHATPANALHENGVSLRFLEGEAVFLLEIPESIHDCQFPDNTTIELTGSIRLIPPNELGREFVRLLQEDSTGIHENPAEQLNKDEIQEAPQTADNSPPHGALDLSPVAPESPQEPVDYRLQALILSRAFTQRLRQGSAGQGRAPIIPPSPHPLAGLIGAAQPYYSNQFFRDAVDTSRRVLRQTMLLRHELGFLLDLQAKRAVPRRHPLSILAALLPQAFLLRPKIRSARRLILDSSLFDALHYRRQCQLGLPMSDPVVHYLVIGWKIQPRPLSSTAAHVSTHTKRNALDDDLTTASNGRLEPHPLFDPDWYVSQYPSVRKSGMSPLCHFLLSGAKEGFNPHPLFNSKFYQKTYLQSTVGSHIPLADYLKNANSRTPSLLFDTAYYLTRNPDVAASGINPLIHFLSTGTFEGRDPSALFSISWYMDRYGHLIAQGQNPLVHYLTMGELLGCRPNPLFDPVWYASIAPAAAASEASLLEHFIEYGAAEGLSPCPLFDCGWYSARYAEVSAAGVNPLAHYLSNGAFEGFNPNPLFHSEWYLRAYPEVAAAGINPLTHYLNWGAANDNNPNPLFDSRWYRNTYPEVDSSNLTPLEHYILCGEAKKFRPHPAFLPDFYRSRNPEVAATCVEPLAHYLECGAKSLISPHPLFDSGFYLAQCPDLAESGIPPLVHYLETETISGLKPHPLFDSAWYLETYQDVSEAHLPPFIHYLSNGAFELRGTSPLFDGEFYFSSIGGIDIGQITPLEHFIEAGGALGLSPCRMFDSTSYLEAYPDVAHSGINPLLHYLTCGEREGRSIPGKFDSVFYARQLGQPVTGQSHLEHFIRVGSRMGILPAPISVLFNLTIPSLLKLPETPRPVASIVIPVHNQFHFTISCLVAIAKAKTAAAFEVIVVDDCSSDETTTLPYRVLNLAYIRNETNLGFGETCNRGAAAARGEFIVFLNNDTYVHDEWLDALIAAAGIPGTGYVGAKLVYPNGRLQEAGGIIWKDGSAWNYGNGDDPNKPEYSYLRKADYCSAAAALVPASLFTTLGGFSPEFARAYYEDTDLCMRIRAAGHNVIYQPLATVTHFEGGTCGTSVKSGVKQQQIINQQIFLEKWQDTLTSHPANGDLQGHFNHLYPAGTILFIDDHIPMPKISSGGQRAWNIIVVLLDLGHHVTFLPSCGCAFPVQEQQEALRALGVQILEPPASDWISSNNSHFSLRSFDKVILARHYITTPLYQEIRSQMPGAALIFDTVDLHYQRLRRETVITRDPVTAQRAEIAYIEETKLLRDCEQTWVVSEIERAELLSINPQADVRVVSNIVDVPGTRTGWESRTGILFIGGFNHPPNQDAVIWFIRDVLPIVLREIPDLVFHILGSSMPEEFNCLASPNINPVGFVDDPGEWFEQVRLSVAPLRYGAGVKGKVNQSLSFGVPVVGTGIAFEGMGIPSGTCVLSAEDPSLMAQHLIHLYNNHQLWESFSATGIRLMHEMYSLESAQHSIAAALSEIRQPVGP